ncbi:ABC-F family ATP-binding cassette domain-containing protein [Streptosporangium sp. KLBMP 9127]|nr:ATP-binding cassette domain-containing protein [Streptosporangium sp. KLBMP 9127]
MRAPQPTQIALSEVTKRYDERVVLDRISFTVKPGERIGVIGDNGSGKSTLLKIIAGREDADAGEVTVVAPGGVGYLAQTLDLPPRATVGDAVDLALAELRDLEARMRRAEADLTEETFDAYSDLIARFEARGGYQADARVDIALHGLGLPGLDRRRPLGTLSGGERSRLALAATLASAPELLLLDEPTNDLDDQAVSWLEQHLRGHRGTVIAITHDRVFLERITATILETEAGAVTRYGDGYDGYLAAKAAARRRRLQEYEDWRTELARNHSLVESNAVRLAAIPRKSSLAIFGSAAFRARSRGHGAMGRIRNAKSRLAELTGNPVAPPPTPLRFTATITSATGNPANLTTDDPAPTTPTPFTTADTTATPHTDTATSTTPATPTATPHTDTATSTTPATPTATPHTDTAAPRTPATPASGDHARAVSTIGNAAKIASVAIGDRVPRTAAGPAAPLAELAGVRVGDRLDVPGLRIRPGERLLVTGPNGAGKSTLIRVLAGELRPDAGQVRLAGRVGHLRQEETPWRPGLTVLDAFAAGRPGDAAEHAGTLLSLGLFRRADLRLRIGELSYGQRRRIELARLVTEPVDLVLLDEPTNHLSPALVEELEAALTTYQGALVVVTHDRRMRSRFTGSHLTLHEGRVTELQAA